MKRLAHVLAALAAFTAGAATLVFHAPLDGNPTATVAAGGSLPVAAEGLLWGDGPVPGTQALLMESQPDGKHPVLAYSAAGNLPGERGTVSLWTKRKWDSGVAQLPWRSLFATPMPLGVDKERVGSGAFWLWWWGDKLRADQSDAKDRYVSWAVSPLDSEWHHVVFTWTPARVMLYVDGCLRSGISDNASPMRDAIEDATAVAPDRSGIDRFFVGCSDATSPADSLIADLRIYDTPLTEDEVRGLFANANEGQGQDWQVVAETAVGRYERLPLSGEAPGTIAPEMLELVDEVRLGHLSRNGRKESKDLVDPVSFVAENKHPVQSVGPLREGSICGVPYLEAGPSKGDRFAVRLLLDPESPLHLVEIDVPDDVIRTEDIIVQPSKGDADYAMQHGLLLGGEYPNTGRILTHRCLFWTRTNDVAVVAMTARAGTPAAVAAIRAYRVKDAALPAVPASRARDSSRKACGRHGALYYEDPAINLEFGIALRIAATPAGFSDELARLAATMRFAGIDTLFYPGAWYQGLIGNRYNPRSHVPCYRVGIYEFFDREGLRFVPTINLNNMPVDAGLVTTASMEDGSLHPSAIAIHDTGKPNPGLWHNTPPNFNILHPEVQRHVTDIFDTLVAEGAWHSSFGGICLHLTKHCLLWWGDEASGYNDYAIEAFCRDTGRAFPADFDRAAPLRGAEYAEWIKSDSELREDWLQWRCDQITAFYGGLAAHLAAVRPDAKLYVNSFVPPDVNHPDFLHPDYMALANRRCGLDGHALTAAIPNIVLMQTSVPADYRWAETWRYCGTDGHVAKAMEKQRVLDSEPGFWSLLDGAAYPWANQHDRYWESAIAAERPSLSCDWLHECRWRVSTLNPAGDPTLRHFVLPFRFHDVLGLSKGGFLVGSIGMEERLAPFLHAFSALPAIPMEEFFRDGYIVGRKAIVNGALWGYVVNTGENPAAVEPGLPAGVCDAVTGEPLPCRISIGPCELRAFTSAIPPPAR